MNLKRKRKALPYIFLVPAIVIIIMIFAIPLFKFFPLERIDEEEKSIEIDCEYKVGNESLFDGRGKTKIYFNEQNNTITVSSDYVPKGESV